MCGCSQFSKSSRILDEKREAVHGKLQVLGGGGREKERESREGREGEINFPLE